jgi:uncharacterized protein YutD
MEIDSCFCFDEFSITKNISNNQVKTPQPSEINVKTQFDRYKFINEMRQSVVITKYDYLKPRIVDVGDEDNVDKNPDDKYEVSMYEPTKYTSEVITMIQNVKKTFEEDTRIKDYIIVEEEYDAEYEINNFDDPILPEIEIKEEKFAKLKIVPTILSI